MNKTSIYCAALLAACLAGCAPAWGTPVETETASIPTTFETQTASATETIPATSTPEVQSLWISPAVPVGLVREADKLGFTRIETAELANFRLNVVPEPISGSTTWIYALVAPFPTITDGVAFSDIQSAWLGAGSGAFGGVPLRMSAETMAAFSLTWGIPAPGATLVEEADQLLENSWETGTAWAIVPFEELSPKWKVLTIDGNSPIRNDFDPSGYPLQVTFSLEPALFGLPTSNRDPSKLTTLIMTGVTAMTRATADRMETKGISYPGEDVKETFLAADLLHISNEIPFNPDCPTPDPYTESLRMCSDPKYVGLLEEIGTDIVELTGNHFQDFGSDATLFTLNMYDERGWVYFGGGRNLEEAKKPILITHNGNRLAFIGCNPAGPDFAWATDGSPGAAWCDYEYMTGEITRLRGEGYLPIVTFQHYESYHLDPVLEQVGDFHTMADAGAVIVSGSQSHVPQYMEFSGNTLLHYGLGNLFFDQMFNSIAGTDTRKEFVDRHVFYDGQYISTELLTYMLEDYARPRQMEDWEREELLQDVFGEYGLLR